MDYSPLTKEEWALHHNVTQADALAESVRQGNLSIQTREMLQITKPGEAVLEIGSGSGETTLALQRAGRRVTAIDFSEGCLELTEAAAHRLNLSPRLVLADATTALPFAVDEFDVSFQAGLLEHFEKPTRVELLRGWGVVSKRMVSLIPNAASIPYLYGKLRMERLKSWPYGLELPQYTLAGEMAAAGFFVEDEYTIGAAQALTFLPRWHAVRLSSRVLFGLLRTPERFRQGYLLVTVAVKTQ